ncbi:hypothetical protein ACA910_020736 [Epithemia clementina (nom. ined.)]
MRQHRFLYFTVPRSELFLLAAIAFTWPISEVLTVAAFASFSAPKAFPIDDVLGASGRRLVVTFYGDMGGGNRRQAQIGQKIAQLKREGRLKNPQSNEYLRDDTDADSANDIYADKIRRKLGDRKSKMLGYSGAKSQDGDNVYDEDEDEAGLNSSGQVLGRIGSLSTTEDSSQAERGGYNRPTDAVGEGTPLIDPTLFGGEMDSDLEDELSEDDLVDIVAQKMREKRAKQQQERTQSSLASSTTTIQGTDTTESNESRTSSSASSVPPQQITSGVGGSWRSNATQNVEMYQPKTGSWGAFPRPRDISKAYGGGRRVGPGYSNEEARLKSAEATRQRLQEYREKAGIEVQSEKDHASEIDEALHIASLAMQRGMYSTAVSALEKVTKYCSTNSKIGGKVFLELAMAYEAVGRTDEAITVYSTLTKCRIEEIKHNAKRLLYGIEAMEFMRNEVKDSSFSRKKIQNTFIDTTGLKHIAQNFDDVYQTAYIDLQGNFYKRFTESVVRSPREARQILLRATNSGEVERTRIVQALRSISRNFDDALEKEIERSVAKEPVAVMDGKPIMPRKKQDDFGGSLPDNDFVLADPAQMFENLSGDWRLQLLADKRGDGVKFFNTTLSLQRINMEQGKFEVQTPVGFGSMQVSGTVEFNEMKRVIRRREVATKGGGMMAALMNPSSGVLGAVQMPQQIMTVDSTLLVTREAPASASEIGTTSKKSRNDEKEYFAVWRRIEFNKEQSLTK